VSKTLQEEIRDQAHRGWLKFLEDVRARRKRLLCSQSGAWFRGQTKAYTLLPSLFRNPYFTHHRSIAKRNWEEFKALQARFEARLQEFSSQRAVQGEEVRIAKGNLRSIKSTSGKAELETCQQRVREISERKSAFEIQGNEKLKDAQKTTNKEIQKQLQLLLKDGGRQHSREREAFHQYRVLSNPTTRSSWEMLAEMRHYGVPTRFLDWSHSFDVAIFFAVENVQAEFERQNCADIFSFIDCLLRRQGFPKENVSPESFFARLRADWNEFFHARVGHQAEFVVSEDTGLPILWVLNPYHACAIEKWYHKHLHEGGVTSLGYELERAASVSDFLGDRNTFIYELTHAGHLDYYRCFLSDADVDKNHEWHCYFPVPIYSPWSNLRLASQQSTFTVHGGAPVPIEEVYGRKVVDFVQMSAEAAIFAIEHLSFQGVDSFTIYRDPDRLGRRITQLFTKKRRFDVDSVVNPTVQQPPGHGIERGESVEI